MLAYAIDYILIVLVQFAILVLIFATLPLVGRIQGLMSQIVDEVAKGDATKLMQSSVLLVALAVFLLVQLLVEWGYFIASEMITGGRSIGKALVGLRVVRDGGLPISFRESLVRNLLRMVDILPSNYAVGLIAMVVSREGKRLGDHAAGTIVIRLDRPAPAVPLAEPGAGEVDAGFRFDREQLRRLGAPERALLRQTLRRLETLAPAQRTDTLERSVQALRERIGYGPVGETEREAFLRALLRAVQTRW